MEGRINKAKSTATSSASSSTQKSNDDKYSKASITTTNKSVADKDALTTKTTLTPKTK